ncbi:hypothetical protein ACHAPO_009291 [Fusarium lateritium]
MKFTLILALPAMALAAATPLTAEKRQLPNVNLPLDIACLQRVANIRQCLPNLGSGTPPVVGDLAQCVATLPLVVIGALGCIDFSVIPTKA